jgi:hypothetical protein
VIATSPDYRMSGGFVWPVCDLGFVDSSFKYTRDRTGRVPRPQTRARRRRTGPAHRPPRRPPAASPQSAPPHPRTLGVPRVPVNRSALTPAGGAAGLFETMSFQSTRPRRYTSIAEFTHIRTASSLQAAASEPAACPRVQSPREPERDSPAHAHAARGAALLL